MAEKAGGGRAVRWQLERPDLPAGTRDPAGQYTTLEDLAQAVHDGLVDADDEQRAVLEQVLADRPPPAPDPRPGRRRWRTVTGCIRSANRSAESFAEIVPAAA